MSINSSGFRLCLVNKTLSAPFIGLIEACKTNECTGVEISSFIGQILFLMIEFCFFVWLLWA